MSPDDPVKIRHVIFAAIGAVILAAVACVVVAGLYIGACANLPTGCH